jgi:DNA-binding GntR family transcriptional regulator
MANTSLSTHVYNEILERILSGRWTPGQLFNRRQVAAELSVSVAPVLEAMLELEAEGLIETAPRKGTRVRTMDLEDLRGQLMVREAIECQAARLYCGAPIERHIDRLLRMATQLDLDDVRSAKHTKNEVRFHHYLVSLAGVPALTQAFERVMKLGLIYTIQVLHPNLQSAPRQLHVDLLNALKVANPDAAEAAMRAHAQSGKEALFNHHPAQAPRRSPKSPSWLRV